MECVSRHRQSAPTTAQWSLALETLPATPLQSQWCSAACCSECVLESLFCFRIKLSHQSSSVHRVWNDVGCDSLPYSRDDAVNTGVGLVLKDFKFPWDFQFYIAYRSLKKVCQQLFMLQILNEAEEAMLSNSYSVLVFVWFLLYNTIANRFTNTQMA